MFVYIGCVIVALNGNYCVFKERSCHIVHWLWEPDRIKTCNVREKQGERRLFTFYFSCFWKLFSSTLLEEELRSPSAENTNQLVMKIFVLASLVAAAAALPQIKNVGRTVRNIRLAAKLPPRTPSLRTRCTNQTPSWKEMKGTTPFFPKVSVAICKTYFQATAIPSRRRPLPHTYVTYVVN